MYGTVMDLVSEVQCNFYQADAVHLHFQEAPQPQLKGGIEKSL